MIKTLEMVKGEVLLPFPKMSLHWEVLLHSVIRRSMLKKCSHFLEGLYKRIRLSSVDRTYVLEKADPFLDFILGRTHFYAWVFILGNPTL